MVETSQPVYFIAVAVVGISLTILGFLLWKTFATSNLFQKGLTLYKQRDYEGAEAAFRQVMKRQHSNDMVRLLLGNVLLEQDKLTEATPVFRELIERSPKNIDAYLRLGEALIKQGQVRRGDACVSEIDSPSSQ
jgi:TolA-binding protein